MNALPSTGELNVYTGENMTKTTTVTTKKVSTTTTTTATATSPKALSGREPLWFCLHCQMKKERFLFVPKKDTTLSSGNK